MKRGLATPPKPGMKPPGPRECASAWPEIRGAGPRMFAALMRAQGFPHVAAIVLDLVHNTR